MKVRIVAVLLAVITLSAVAAAQDRVSLRPIFKPGEESRYSIGASVETLVTSKGSNGIGGTFRAELTAVVLLRTVSVTDAGEINQEAVVESISFSSAKGNQKETAGGKIEFAITPSGHVTKCSIPGSRGYLALADLVFSLMRWRPNVDVAVGDSWETLDRGVTYTGKLSEIPIAATTIFKLASFSKEVGSIEGTITLNQNGSSSFNPGDGLINVSVIASGMGSAKIQVDSATGRLIGGATESRVEGTLLNIRPTAAGEKMQPREGSFVETSKFSVTLIR